MKSVVLDDGKEYLILDKIDNKSDRYVFLIDKDIYDDQENFVVRKEIIENDKTFFVGLKDKTEVEQALKLFIEKNAK